MGYKTYNRDALTGGAARALDGIAVATLANKDRAIVDDPTYGFLYFTFNATSTDAETVAAHPFKIRPDDYATAGVWIEIEPSKGHDRSHAITSSDDHTSTSTENVIQKGDANGLPVDSGITEDASGNVLIAGASAAGTSAAKVIVVPSGTAPTTCPADVGQLWVADKDGAAGYSALHTKASEAYNVDLCLGENLIHFAKEQMIVSVKQIVTSGIELFLVFDEYGAVSTIADRSGNGRDATLRDGSLNAIDASTCAPGLLGLAPCLLRNATHVWDVSDADGLTFGDGAGNDVAFSIVFVGALTETGYPYYLCKSDNGTQLEYALTSINSGGGNRPTLQLFTDSSNKIGRIAYGVNIQPPTLYSICCTYDGSKASSGMKIYINGAVDGDLRDSNSGTYTGMSNTTSKVYGYSYSSGVPSSVYSKGIRFCTTLIIRAELTATQIAQLDAILRSWAGVMI